MQTLLVAPEGHLELKIAQSMLAKRGAGQQGDHDALTSPSSPLASESRLSEDLLMQPRTC